MALSVTLEVTDPADHEAVTWARERYNESPETDENGDPVLIETDEEYILFVARRAIDSYRAQKAQSQG